MTVVPPVPPDDDEVARYVQAMPFPAALGSEPDVVKRWVLDELAAEATTPVVALHDQPADGGGNVAVLLILAAAQEQLILRRRLGR